MPLMQDFDAQRERSVIAEMLLKRSAKLILGRSELEIIRGVCQAIVDVTSHIRLAWTWFGPTDTHTIRPQVYAGPAAAYAESLNIERNLLTRIGPAFTTLDGKSAGPFTVSQFSPFGPWRDAARHHGILHVLALPIASTFNGYSGILMSLNVPKDSARAQRVFDALAAGGQVQMPYAKTFWAEGFGMLTDKFGVPWMVNCQA